MSLPALVRDRRAGLPVATTVLLCAVAATPEVSGRSATLVLAAVMLLLAAVVLSRQLIALPQRLSGSRRPVRRPIVEMALHLSPVLLLTAAFPIAVERLEGTEVGGAPLTTLLLAASLTTPWLSMAVCLPLYRGIGHLIQSDDLPAIRKAFCAIWPTTFLQVVPTVALFAIPMQLTMDWSATALATYVALCLLHMAFAQSLILANVARNRKQWALAWAAYAAALLVLPAAWFLPPLVGLLTQVFPLRRVMGATRGAARLDLRDVAADVTRGLLLGSVLWAHVLFLFWATRGVFAVTTVFIALLPAVFAYNYYFVRLAPNFDRGVLRLRHSMETESADVMARRSRGLSSVVENSVARTAFMSAVLGAVITIAVSLSGAVSLTLISTVVLASWAFLMVTLLCYKLDYIGAKVEAQVISGAHLLLSAGAFALLPAGPALYGWLFLLELPLVGWALSSCLRRWRSPAYVLFWRHATAW